jgi:uncharacterized protein (DUF697 family)
MASTKQNVHEIIKSASVASGAIGAGLAQAPESDSTAIDAIHTNMIMAIAAEHGIGINHADASDLLHSLSETIKGRQVHFSRQAMAGWLPGIDNANNDPTTTARTEAIGWAANSHFDQIENKRQDLTG